MADTKLTEAAIKKLLGTRTPLPGGVQQSPQLIPVPVPAAAASGPSGIGALPANPVMNPGAIARQREETAEQGMKKGGKVKKHSSGGTVRGSGCAIRGIRKWSVR